MMGDKSANQQQQSGNPWGNAGPWALAAYSYANRNHPGFNHPAYAQQAQQYYGFYNQQQMPYNGHMGNNMQMQNGMQFPNNMGHHNMGHNVGHNQMVGQQMTGFPSQAAQTAHTPLKKEKEEATSPVKKEEDASLPPLPPGPPPSINGNTFPPPTTAAMGSTFYGQPTNNPFAPIKFNVNAVAKKMAYNNINNNVSNNVDDSDDGRDQTVFTNSGASKKKRRKNKMNKMSQQQFESAFPHVQPPLQPPLPKEVPPPFPPLPPLPKEPPPAGPSPGPSPATFSTTARTLQESVKAVAHQPTPSPLLPTPKYNFGSDVWKQVESWPESLQAYVNRCYAKCVEVVDKDQVEIILKGKITRAANEGALHTRNWDMEPLPSLYSERNLINIRKKPFASASAADLDQGPSTSRQSGTGHGGTKRGRGLSAAMGSRLGGFGRGQRGSPQARSSSPFGRGRRNRSRSDSRSPPRRRKDKRRSTDSSSSRSRSSSEENCRPQATASGGGKKAGGHGKQPDMGMSKRAQKKLIKQYAENRARRNFVAYVPIVMKADPVNSERMQKRAARFETSLTEASPSVTPRRRPLSLNASTANISIVDDTDIDWTNLHIVGTCQNVAKPYFRLTTAPDPSTVRPVEILQKALEEAKEKWKISQEYHNVCDQMKSIRQDLTVQGIRDEFTVKVYETHARIAIEKGDHEEFNQCQTQLKMLYHDVKSKNCLEFTAYRILYYIFTKNTLDLTTTLASLSPSDKADPCVAHALELRSAWSLGNYHRLFKLYRNAPRMAASLMDWFVERERKSALKVMIKSYRAVLPLSFVVQELAFESSAKGLEFLTQFGLIFENSLRTKIDCKKSVAIIGNL